MITKPGIYEITETEYHADPCIEPSLSHSIAKMLLNESPRHAKHAHPRLTPQEEEDDSAVMEAGSALHKLILGKGAEIVVLEFNDYKKDAAKEARAAAKSVGKIPILMKAMERISSCANEAIEQIKAHPDLLGFYKPGRSEIALVWHENGIWCRALVDRLDDNGQAYDLKSTMLSAAPWSWERRLQTEYATQDAFYRRGLTALGFKNPPPLIFIPIEQKAPFCISSLAADSTLQFWATQEIERAIETWRECLTADHWPGFPAVTYHASATGWMLDKQEERASGASFQSRKPSRKALNFAAEEFDNGFV